MWAPEFRGIASSRWSEEHTMYLEEDKFAVVRATLEFEGREEYPMSSRWSMQLDGFAEGYVSSGWSAHLRRKFVDCVKLTFT